QLPDSFWTSKRIRELTLPARRLILRRPARLLAEERRGALDDAPLLFHGDLGEHRKRQHAASCRFADREVAFAVAEEAEAFLQVQRDRVVDLAADLLVAEVLDERVTLAAADADDVLIEDVSSVRQHRRPIQDAAEAVLVEQLVVAPGRRLPLRRP